MSTVAQPSLKVGQLRAVAWPPWVLAACDAGALEVCLGSGLALRRCLGSWLPAEIGRIQYLGVAAGLLLLPLVYYQIGLYPGYLLGPVERLRRRTLATVALFGALVAWDNLVSRGVFSRGVLLATFGFALILPPIVESCLRRAMVQRRLWGAPVVMLGCGDAGRALARALLREPELGLRPVAFFDNRPETWSTVAEGVPVLGPLGLAQDYERRAHAAIVSTADLGNEDAAALLQELNFPRVIVMPDLGDVQSLWVSARCLGGALGLEIKKNLLLRRNVLLKLTMDRIVALLLFVLSLPVMALAAAWIKLSSRGPVLYKQSREGLEGRRVTIVKLRTMCTNSDQMLQEWLENHPEDRAHWNRHFKLPHDPRVLPLIGPLLRRTSLDELPQLWSVLCGEMSLVGPRPLPDYHLGQFKSEFRSLRSRVLPGLTGLWQVSARADADLETLEGLDTYYIRNWSPWLDLYILARTVTAVLFARGAY